MPVGHGMSHTPGSECAAAARAAAVPSGQVGEVHTRTCRSREVTYAHVPIVGGGGRCPWGATHVEQGALVSVADKAKVLTLEFGRPPGSPL